MIPFWIHFARGKTAGDAPSVWRADTVEAATGAICATKKFLRVMRSGYCSLPDPASDSGYDRGIMRCAALLIAACSLAAQTDGFEHLATYKGLGGLVASAVGPGPGESSQRFYLSYLYIDNTIDVVGVDPDSGDFDVYSNPARTESGARCMVLGPDGKLYLGTLPRAHFLELDPKAGTLRDLGRPSPTEQYIWDVAFGPDGKLYGATYPQSKLVRYDPATGALED